MQSQGPVRLLVADRDSGLLERYRRVLSSLGVAVHAEAGLAGALEHAEQAPYDILLIEGGLIEDGDAEDSAGLTRLKQRQPDLHVIALAEEPDLERTIAALGEGVDHYLRLPADGEELRLLLEQVVERVQRLREPVGEQSPAAAPRLAGIIGQSRRMRSVFRLTRQAAETDVPVLVTGETGTGKDLIASAIHRLSARSDGPYVAVHLGALPSELLAGELFGHEKGAFTGAVEQREGKFELADRGSIFLDEIGCMDEKVQISLLRLLEKKTFHRLGGQHPITVDARIIAATNSDIAQEVERGTFREDLFYRLDVFNITLPPLRERRNDIPLLAQAFLERYARDFERPVERLSPECENVLRNYPWPGNVRELKNVIQRAVLVCQSPQVEPEHLPPRFRPDQPSRDRVSFTIGTPLEQVEREMLVRTLESTQNNRKRAAQILGISRRTLYNKLAKYHLA